MRNSNSIVLKTRHSTVFNLGKIQKALCIIDAENIAKLLNHISLAANPRESKKNKVTSSIIDTLSTSPEEMVNRTKGLLVSTQKCEILERGRFRLSFEDEKTDGVLDGGHNMLAIGTFLLEKYHEEIGNIPTDIMRIKCWEDFSLVWAKYSNPENNVNQEQTLNDFIKKQDFLIPVEIIFPSKDEYFDFAELVFEISDARNNNSPLTAGTKADHRGYYDNLKSKIDKKIVDLVSWKDNEAGKRIKREDVVSLSLIPLIALQRKGLLDKEIKTINPSVIYNSKAQCVEIYSNIVEHYRENLPKVIDSAFSLMQDIPMLYDLIYKEFPRIYNDHSPGFGRITAVNKRKDGSPKFLTKFYKKECDFKYPDGYILPFICSLHELIIIDNDHNVKWGVDVYDIINDSSKYGMLIGTIKDNYYDPQKVGKSSAAYTGCEMTMKMIMMSL